jgi:hypothetical protein
MSSRVTSLLLATVLTAGMAGCDGGDPEPGPSPSAQESESSATASPSESSSPSVAPATGPLIEMKALDLRLYDGPEWDIQSYGSVTGGGYRTDEGTVDVAVSDLATTDTDLDADAEVVLEIKADEDPAPRRLENRTVNGVECWVIAGKNDERRTYAIGGLHAGYQFSVEFEVPADWPEADQRIEEILASIRWK